MKIEQGRCAGPGPWVDVGRAHRGASGCWPNHRSPNARFPPLRRHGDAEAPGRPAAVGIRPGWPVTLRGSGFAAALIATRRADPVAVMRILSRHIHRSTPRMGSRSRSPNSTEAPTSPAIPHPKPLLTPVRHDGCVARVKLQVRSLSQVLHQDAVGGIAVSPWIQHRPSQISRWNRQDGHPTCGGRGFKPAIRGQVEPQPAKALQTSELRRGDRAHSEPRIAVLVGEAQRVSQHQVHKDVGINQGHCR